MNKKNRIEIRVTGPNEDQEVGVFLPWDANIEDWISTFKVILVHQSFAQETIEEIFFNGNTDFRMDVPKFQSEDKEWKEPDILLLKDDRSTFQKQESTMANAY